MRILIVEDEKKLLSILTRALSGEGYAVDGVTSVAEGYQSIKSYHYDLIILDLQLSDGNGLSLLKRVREQGQLMPVLILTARADLDVKLDNFRSGADDYVIKPIAMAELAIRVQALLRRGPTMLQNTLNIAGLEIDRLARQVKRDGKRIELSAKEYAMLEYLMLNAGRLLSRSMIVEKVWDQSFEGLTNIVDVYIGHLRRKVDDGYEPKLIRTVRGLGYVLEKDLAT